VTEMREPPEDRTWLQVEGTKWLDDKLREMFEAYPPLELPPALRKPVDWQAEIARWQQIVADMPPVRAEPIKLTPFQWAVLPKADPRIPPYARPLGDLLGIPVVMVASEAESTPVVEGWLKPKRRRWWQRLRRQR